jgi:preprotein translocase subunit SecE
MAAVDTKAPDAASSPLDIVKLVLAVAALLGGLIAYYWFEDASIVLRVLGVIAGVIVSAGLVFWTEAGQSLWSFIQGSRLELRKVVWPTRKETEQTTLMVVIFVLVMGIFFWGLDWLLLIITRAVTGQGG